MRRSIPRLRWGGYDPPPGVRDWWYPQRKDGDPFLLGSSDVIDVLCKHKEVELSDREIANLPSGIHMELLMMTSYHLGVNLGNVERFLEMCSLRVIEKRALPRLGHVAEVGALQLKHGVVVDSEKRTAYPSVSTLNTDHHEHPLATTLLDKLTVTKTLLHAANETPPDLICWDTYDALAKWEGQNCRLLPYVRDRGFGARVHVVEE